MKQKPNILFYLFLTLLPAAGFCASIDLAASGSASQSTDYGTGQFPASRGIDGNTGNFTHTLSVSNSWWMYEFTTAQEVESFEIFNRSDCCGNRLGNLTVRVTNDVGVLIFEEKIGVPQSNGSRWERTLPVNSMVKSLWIGLVGADQNGGANSYVTIGELEMQDTTPGPPATGLLFGVWAHSFVLSWGGHANFNPCHGAGGRLCVGWRPEYGYAHRCEPFESVLAVYF